MTAAFFDIDGTLTQGGEAWGALLTWPDVNRMKKAWLYTTALPHHLLSRTRVVSQEGFRDRWIHLMAWMVAGWPATQVQTLCDRTVHDHLAPMLRPDVVNVLKQHQAQGHRVVLISTMFEGFVGGLARYLGADAGLGSGLEMRDGVCTGRIAGPTCLGPRKVVFAQSYLERNLPDVSLDSCFAYADSRSDIPLLAAVGNPVVTYPDDVMRAAALQRGWRIYP
jgi:HAD superfamily hydrolase (TIGR01490 family)